MVEATMHVTLGFLTASLLALVIIPLIHDRAVRLTLRRINAAMPLSIEEIQTEKDQLRAEFAMSTRRRVRRIFRRRFEFLKTFFRIVSRFSTSARATWSARTYGWTWS